MKPRIAVLSGAFLMAAAVCATAQVDEFAAGPGGQQRIDLGVPGAVSYGQVEATIYDTRTVQPQIQGGWPWVDEIEIVKDHLPVHWVDGRFPIGPPNDLEVGGVFDAQRAFPTTLFPGISQTRFSPPDPTMAVGPNHIIETVNSTIAFFSKDGDLQFSVQIDNLGDPGFFEEVGAGNFVVDPKVMYDHIAQRFVVVAIEVYRPNSAWFDIAVSDDSNPHGVWYKYRMRAEIPVGAGTYWVDYPSFGYDSEAYYTGGNLFILRGTNDPTPKVLFRMFDKAPMLVGGTATWADLVHKGNFTARAGHHFGANQAGFHVGVNSTSSMRIYAIKDPAGSPSLVSTTVSVPSFTPAVRFSAPNFNGRVDPLDGRMFAAAWRDGNLYSGHAINVGGRNVARWYQFDTKDWPNSGSPSLVQSGNVDLGGNIHTFFPHLMENKKGDVGMVMARSSSTEFVSMIVTGRKAGDPKGFMAKPTIVKVGDRVANGRWGDYYAIGVDPNDDTTYWAMGQFQDAGGWATWISSFCISSPNGDMNCDCGIDLTDVQGFILALLDPVEYAKQYPDCDVMNADLDDDGTITLKDIEPFIDALVG